VEWDRACSVEKTPVVMLVIILTQCLTLASRIILLVSAIKDIQHRQTSNIPPLVPNSLYAAADAPGQCTVFLQSALVFIPFNSNMEYFYVVRWQTRELNEQHLLSSRVKDADTRPFAIHSQYYLNHLRM
jgi:hypothetical protein